MDVKAVERYMRLLYNRLPLIGGRLRQWAMEALARDGSPESVRVLAQVVTRGDDGQVLDAARQALRQLARQDSVDAVCQAWAETRQADLAALLVERQWVASTPPKVRLLTALRTDRLDAIRDGEAKVVPLLVEACKDADPIIVE